jgi:hypothetical protein
MLLTSMGSLEGAAAAEAVLVVLAAAAVAAAAFLNSTGLNSSVFNFLGTGTPVNSSHFRLIP